MFVCVFVFKTPKQTNALVPTSINVAHKSRKICLEFGFSFSWIHQSYNVEFEQVRQDCGWKWVTGSKKYLGK